MKLNKKNIILASILGLILGKYVLGAFFLNMEAQYFEIPVYNTVLISSVYILALIVVVLITIVTYLSCRGILKESAVDALRTEIPKVKNTKFDLTTKGIFKRSSCWRRDRYVRPPSALFFSRKETEPGRNGCGAGRDPNAGTAVDAEGWGIIHILSGGRRADVCGEGSGGFLRLCEGIRDGGLRDQYGAEP